MTILQPQFEMNPAHPIIKKLTDLPNELQAMVLGRLGNISLVAYDLAIFGPGAEFEVATRLWCGGS